MKKRNSDTCMILIIPPTAESLINRRKDRSEERIKNDIQNLETAKNFDYVIVIFTREKYSIKCLKTKTHGTSSYR